MQDWRKAKEQLLGALIPAQQQMFTATVSYSYIRGTGFEHMDIWEIELFHI
jgi:hypothetical protein